MKQVKVKKIKKIPKYSEGGLAELSDKSGLAPGKTIQPDAVTKKIGQDASNVFNKNFGGGVGTQSMPSFSGISALNTGMGVAAAASQPIATGLGIEQGTAGQIGSTIGKAVGLINPIAGLAIEAISPFLGGIGGNDYSKITTTNDATIATTEKSGIIGKIFGKNTNKLHREANQYQNSLVATELTSNLRAEWANDPRNQSMTFNAKDGGIVPELVHAKVSKGELYYDPYNKTLSRVPGSPNKPNTDDDVDAFLARGGMVVTNNDEQPLINGKTQAIALAPMIDKPGKKMSEGTIAARDAIVRKTVRRNEMAKLNKPENRNKILHASEGDIVPYSYNKDMSQFEYWDKDKNDYKKEYIDWVNSLTDQDVKDIYSEKYGDMSTYLEKNKNYIPTVEQARMLMTDKKYGDWHKIAKAVKTQMDSRVAPVRLSKAALDKATPTYNDSPWYTGDGQMRWNLSKFGNKNIIKSDPYKKPFDWRGLMDTIADYAPLVAAYANKPEWDVESASTWIPEYVPVAVDKANQIRAIKDVINTSKYNIKNISPSTGAYMAYASNAASQAAKQYADIYTDKTNEEFARIAHNAGIHNQWAPQITAAIDQAKANTQANKAAAYEQKDVNIKDAMSYLRDQQMLPFLKQYLSSGAYNSSIKKLV